MTRDRCLRGLTHSSLTISVLKMVHLPSTKKKIEIHPKILLFLIIIVIFSLAIEILFIHRIINAYVNPLLVGVHVNNYGEFIYELIAVIVIISFTIFAFVYLLYKGIQYLNKIEDKEYKKAEKGLYAILSAMAFLLTLIIVKVII